MREVRWERMFIDELEEAFARCPVVYFAYGLCEPHGPQNAVGLDALKAYNVACRAACEHGGIVAPPDFWHVHEIAGYANWAHHSIGNVERSWLTSMPPWQHFKNVCYHVRTADALGFHAAIFFTGHYGPNWMDLITVLELLQPHVGTKLYGLPGMEANEPGFDGDNARGDHAGKVETSLLWALEPDCVDVSRMPAAGTPGKHWAMGANAYQSSRRIGERMVADEARYLGAKATELLAAYDRDKPKHASLTFGEVERLWDTLIAPKVKDFKSMQAFGQKEPLPADSVWQKNQAVPERFAGK